MKRFRNDPVFGDLGNIRNLGRYWKSQKAESAIKQEGEWRQMTIFDLIA